MHGKDPELRGAGVHDPEHRVAQAGGLPPREAHALQAVLEERKHRVLDAIPRRRDRDKGVSIVITVPTVLTRLFTVLSLVFHVVTKQLAVVMVVVVVVVVVLCVIIALAFFHVWAGSFDLRVGNEKIRECLHVRVD